MALSSLGIRVATGVSPRTYTVRPYPSTRTPTARELHILNRMGCGYSVSSLSQLRAAGGELAWFDAQLAPGSIPENSRTRSLPSWFPDLQDGAKTRFDRDANGGKRQFEYARDHANYQMLRRVYSERTVYENIVGFWSDHLHVPVNKSHCFIHRSGYDDVIREHALGTFEELLLACSLHPAMLLYLDNWKSIKNFPNENQGRELLELHTVGREAGYSEAMVLDSAKILSGFTVNDSTWQGFYDEGKHTTGAVHVLGFSNPNSRTDGRDLTREYLRYLANHPATARRIARKLAIRFVSDSPSEGLVNHLATVFRESGTDIKATLRALVDHDEFWASAGLKVRTPIDDMVATCRVLGVKAKTPHSQDAFAHDMSWVHGSLLLHHWPRPDGAPDDAVGWSTTTRMLNSFKMHWNLAGGYYPRLNVSWKKPRSYLPEKRLRIDEFVDHMSRVVLGRPSTEKLLKAVCQGIEVAPSDVIDKNHAVFRYKLPRLLCVLLDSPAHLTR